MMRTQWMIYGATGVTGQMVVKEAVSRGHRPVLAGRSAVQLHELASMFNLEYVRLALNDGEELSKQLQRCKLLLNCAGPFVDTAPLSLRACMAASCHYLDISGEIHVMQQLQAAHATAQKAGILMMPGVGYGVVAGEMAAHHTLAKLPGASRMRLSIDTQNGLTSGGALRSTLEVLSQGGFRVEDSKPERVALACRRWKINVLGEVTSFAEVPAPETFMVAHSTHIPSVSSGIPMSTLAAWATRCLTPILAGVLKDQAVKNALTCAAGHGAQKATEDLTSRIYAEAWDSKGNKAQSRLVTGEGYAFAALAAVTAVEGCMQLTVPIGFNTPLGTLGLKHFSQMPNVWME